MHWHTQTNGTFSIRASSIHVTIFHKIFPPSMSLLSSPAHQSPRGQVGLSWGTLEQRCLSRWKQCSLRRPLSDKRVPLPLLLYHSTAVEWLQSPNGCRYLLLVWSSIKALGKKKKKKTRGKRRGGSECMCGFNVCICRNSFDGGSTSDLVAGALVWRKYNEDISGCAIRKEKAHA